MVCRTSLVAVESDIRGPIRHLMLGVSKGLGFFSSLSDLAQVVPYSPYVSLPNIHLASL